MQIEITSENYEATVLNSNRPLIVQFVSIYSGFNQRRNTSEFSEFYDTDITFAVFPLGKSYEQDMFAESLNISHSPTTFVYVDGKLIKKWAGKCHFECMNTLIEKINAVEVDGKTFNLPFYDRQQPHKRTIHHDFQQGLSSD